MELRQLEYFVAVAEELHFAKAAARLHVAQPSVSQQIKALETELGVLLFDRSSRTVQLTGPGTELLSLSTQLLDDAGQIRRVAQSSARRLSGRIRIGFLADEYAHARSERLLTRLRRTHPRVVLEFHQVDFASHHDALETGEVDVSFVAGPTPPSIIEVPLFEWPRLVAVSNARAALIGSDARSGLAEEPVALPNQMAAQDWRLAWTPFAERSGQTFVVGESTMEAILAVVGTGRAVCVVPEYVARFYPQPGVTFLAVPGVGLCSVGIGALATRQAEPHVAAFLGIARLLDEAAHRHATGQRRGRAPRPGSSRVASP